MLHRQGKAGGRKLGFGRLRFAILQVKSREHESLDLSARRLVKRLQVEDLTMTCELPAYARDLCIVHRV